MNISNKVPTLHSDQTVSQARRLIADDTSKFDSINYLYIVSKNNKLKGVVSLKDVFRENPTRHIRDIMMTKLVKAHPDTSQEKVARLAVKNNIKAIPIVDKQDSFLGAVTNDSILQILDHESQVDLLRIGGLILHKPFIETGEALTISRSFALRVPWILIGLMGGLFTAKVIGLYDHILEEEVIFASFIPLVAYVANAVGNQTQTLYIRDLATKPDIKLALYSVKQIVTTFLIGLTSWAAIILITTLFWESLILGVIVGLAVFIAILVATIFSLIIPTMFERLNIDPATGSGPFTTVIQDLLSVLVYLTIANLFLIYI